MHSNHHIPLQFTERYLLVGTPQETAEHWIQCGRCQKWRRHINGHLTLSEDQEWVCTHNTDPLYNSCQAAEEEESDAEPTEGQDEYGNEHLKDYDLEVQSTNSILKLTRCDSIENSGSQSADAYTGSQSPEAHSEPWELWLSAHMLSMPGGALLDVPSTVSTPPSEHHQVMRLDGEITQLRHKLKNSLSKSDIVLFNAALDDRIDEVHGHVELNNMSHVEKKLAKQAWRASRITKDLLLQVMQDIPDVWHRVKLV